MHRKVLAGVRFAIIALGILAGCTSVAAATVEIEVHDTTPFHVFPPGTPFTVDITARLTAGSSPPGLVYQWRNFRGDPMGPAVPLTLDVRITVEW